MNFEIKALLTLLLLKTGTNSPEIHNASQLAAACRAATAEEPGEEPAEEPAETCRADTLAASVATSCADVAPITARRAVRNEQLARSLKLDAKEYAA